MITVSAGISSRSCPQFQKVSAAGRKQSLQRDLFCGVFVGAIRIIPESLLVIRTFIIAYRRFFHEGILLAIGFVQQLNEIS